MKIAVFSDPHLGYARFEADSYAQAERAIASASEKADLILCAGDIFDTKIPKLETLKAAVEIFRKAKVPIIAIHGNHERRTKDLVNPAQLLAASTGFKLLHGDSTIFEKNGETVQVFGLGSVPEEYATAALKKTLERFTPREGAFRILMIHQTIKELIHAATEEVSMEYLETLPFDLIIDGHIHETATRLGGRFLIPGSTVVTQLKKEQMQSRGYFLYDTVARKAEFVPIASRSFFYEELVFKDAETAQIREEVRKKVAGIRKGQPDAIIAIKIEGTLKPGLSSSDLRIDCPQDVFIDNRLNVESLGEKLNKIRSMRQESLSVKELALKELDRKTKGRITLFDSAELFEKLIAGPEETIRYLESVKKGSKAE